MNEFNLAVIQPEKEPLNFAHWSAFPDKARLLRMAQSMVLVDFIKNSGLPPEVAQFVVGRVNRSISRMAILGAQIYADPEYIENLWKEHRDEIRTVMPVDIGYVEDERYPALGSA